MTMTTFRSAVLRVAVFAIGAAALSSLPAIAQEPSAPPVGQSGPRHGGIRGNQVDFLTRQLNLTPDQVTQVKAIDEDTWKQMRALRDDTSTVGPDRHAKMMDIRKASQARIRALLTPDQQTRFDALEAQRRKHRENRGAEPDGPPPPPAPQP